MRVDPVARERRVQLGERLGADALELVQLVLRRSASRPLRSPCVSECSAKPPLRPRRAERDVLGLDEDDLAPRLALLRDQRRPQPGEAAADDREVARRARPRPAGTARARRARPPVRARRRVGEEVVEAARLSRAQSVRRRAGGYGTVSVRLLGKSPVIATA